MSDNKKDEIFQGFDEKYSIIFDKPIDWEKIFDNIRNLTRCKICKGLADIQCFKELKMNFGEYKYTDFVHSHYLCNKCHEENK